MTFTYETTESGNIQMIVDGKPIEVVFMPFPTSSGTHYFCSNTIKGVPASSFDSLESAKKTTERRVRKALA